MRYASKLSRAGFTLIELLIVIAIVAILSAAVVVILNPLSLVQKARDAQRISDLQSLSDALKNAEVEDFDMGSSTIVYTSLPDTSSTCGSYTLPTLPSGYSYRCVTEANLTRVDGNGWVPVNLAAVSTLALSQLPIDPTNSATSSLFYTYTPGGSFELTAGLENSENRGTGTIAGDDGGSSPATLEVGTNLALTPLSVEEFKRDSSLVGYWPLDGGSGTSANDASGNGNAGTLTGGPTWASSTSCKKGNCLIFDGVDDYVSVAHNSGLSPSSAITIAAWIKPRDISGQTFPPVIKKVGSVTGHYTMEICTWDGGGSCSGGATDRMIAFAIHNGSSVNPGYYQTALSLNEWYFVVGTYDGTTARFYVNGGTISQTTSSGAITATDSALNIGRDPINTNRLFDGFIDEVRVYSRALSSAEVAALYHATR